MDVEDIDDDDNADFVAVMSSKDAAVQHVCELVQRRLRLASPDDVWRLTPEQLEAALNTPQHASSSSWASRARAAVTTARTVLDVAIVTCRIATVVTLAVRLQGALRF